jgi:CDGSH-type Zn-finger protein
MNDTPGRKVTVIKDGPYRVEGSIPLAKQTIFADDEGGSRDWLQGERIETTASYALCRCGQSSNKPFCDGTHLKVGFDGTEVASREPYAEQAQTFDGPAMDLTDAQSLCASGRFCDPDGSVWRLIGKTDDPELREKVQRMAGNCPAGRLVVWDKLTGQPLEPQLEPSIGLVEDPVAEASGPLWLRGGITIESAEGDAYDVRNRVTLCRCGASENKPFCDGSHVSAGFRDGL